jgi:DNA-binding SARP family transcriptional activator
LRSLLDGDGPTYLSVLAELVAARLAQLAPDVARVVKDEAARRPGRWRPALRRVITTGSDPAAVLACAQLLEEIGTAEDVPALRGLARSLKGAHASPGLGRRLARAVAPRVFVEDQGRVAVRIGEELVAGTSIRRKVLAFLCYLLSRPGLSATRDQVIDVLWPDLEPEVAVNSLHQTVYFLRRLFEPGFKESLTAGYVHHDSDLVWLDPELVTSRSVRCQELIRGIGASAAPEVVERLSCEYRGRFALDFEYEEWAGPYRDGLHASYLDVIERNVAADSAAGHFDRAVRLARKALDIDPDADHIEVLLLRLYRATGAHAAAAEQYAHYASALRDQLGVEPPTLEAL